MGPVDLPLCWDADFPCLPFSFLVIASAFNTLHFGIIKEAALPVFLSFSPQFSLAFVCVFLITPPVSGSWWGEPWPNYIPRRVGACICWRGCPLIPICLWLFSEAPQESRPLPAQCRLLQDGPRSASWPFARLLGA